MIQQTSFTRKDLSILIGNALDHFDTALYGFLVPILAPLFFPTGNPVIRLILAYSIFATSSITKLVGIYLFSKIAKIHGEVVALSYSLMGLAITTISIGLIPTYQVVGWISPLILITIRMIQGICAAGEQSIAKLYILKDKRHNLAFRASYLYEFSVMFGIILASVVSMILISSNYHEYWRLCFIIGGFTGMIGYLLRRSSSSRYGKEISHGLGVDNLFSVVSICTHKLIILRISIIYGFSYLTYSIPFIVMNNFIPLITSISLKVMMSYNTIFLIVDMIMLPLIGRLLENYNPIKILITVPTLLCLSILPLWWNLDNASLSYIIAVRFWFIILGVIFCCPLNVWLNSLFDSSNSDKYMIISIGSVLGTTIIGHLTPFICLSLWYLTSTSLFIGLYIVIIALVTIYVIRSLRIRTEN